jgi:hypothetical protein
VVIRAHTFFKLVQADWIAKMRKNNKDLIITNENESNISTGGDCNVFEILDSLKTAMQNEPA